MAIIRVTALWTGFSGAPGYTNLFFQAFGGTDVVDAEVEAAGSLFAFLPTILPDDVRITVEQECAIIDEATGELISYAQASESYGSRVGTQTGGYSAPSGAAITWSTDGIARGRRLRGRTFLVPLANTAYQNDGTLTGDAIEAIQMGADNFVSGTEGATPVVWSRPRNGSGGTASPITSYRVADKAAVLRSRRD